MQMSISVYHVHALGSTPGLGCFSMEAPLALVVRVLSAAAHMDSTCV